MNKKHSLGAVSCQMTSTHKQKLNANGIMPVFMSEHLYILTSCGSFKNNHILAVIYR